MIYISNAFSGGMLDREKIEMGTGLLRAFKPLTQKEARRILIDAERQGVTVQSIIGHADTAALFSRLLRREVACNRVSVTLREPCSWQEKTLIFYRDIETFDDELRPHYLFVTEESDRLIFGQYIGPRLPEGVTALPEGATIEWWWY